MGFEPDHGHMNTLYSPPKDLREDLRSSLARELSRYYHELSEASEKPAPQFSLTRVVEAMTHERGLMDGYEHELCGATAVTAGESYDKHRVLIPLKAIATRDLTAASAAGGGYLVGVDTAQPLDVLRPYSVAVEAGVTVLPNLVGDLVVPRVTAASTAGWVSTEGTSFVDGQPTVGQAALRPKLAALTVNISRQWRLQSAEAGEVLLRQQVLGAGGTLIDQAFFSGTGANGQPLGLHAVSGIGTQSGTDLAHAGLLAQKRQVLAAGARESALTWVGTPLVQEALGARERASGGGRFLWDDGQILGAAAHATANAPADTLTVGDFSRAVLGIWGPPALRLEINPYQDFPRGGVAVRVVLACDVCFPIPAAFSVASSIT